MTKRILSILLTMLLTFGIFSIAATANTSTDFATEVLRLVNIERTSRGLNPLHGIAHVNLTAAAQLRAVELQARFSHTRPDSTAWSTVFAQFGLNVSFAGENIALGQATPAAVMDSWMNSSGHRSNILHPEFTHLGVGVHVDGSGRHHWAQLFVRDANAPRDANPIGVVPRNTIFNTSWTATWYNWLLFFVGFGFIWMWF